MGWGVTLYWKRPGQPWVTYYLDHDGPYWRQVEMVRTPDRLLVKRAGKVMGQLNPRDYSFYCQPNQHTYAGPTSVVLGEPTSRRRPDEIVPDNPRWKSVWPVMVEPSVRADLPASGSR